MVPITRRVVVGAAIGAATMMVHPSESHAVETTDRRHRDRDRGRHRDVETITVHASGSDLSVVGELYRPSRSHRRHTDVVDVVVHGATYTGGYWRSYVERAVESGRAVFTYDRIGVGRSLRPPSPLVTIDADAHVLHAVTRYLRHRMGFDCVNVIGHSYGSMIAISEAAQYDDIDALVLTGFLHCTGRAIVDGSAAQVPARDDPSGRWSGHDVGWTTTPAPAVNRALFHGPDVDANTLETDEREKSVVSSAQFDQGRSQRGAPAVINISRQVNLPVLLVAGVQDRLYCVDNVQGLDCADDLAVLAFERPYYDYDPRVVMIPDAGHNVTQDAPDAAYAAIDEWVS